MRTLIGSFSLLIVLFISGCAVDSGTSDPDPVADPPRLFDEKIDSPSTRPDPAPFAEDHDSVERSTDVRRLTATTKEEASDPK